MSAEWIDRVVNGPEGWKTYQRKGHDWTPESVAGFVLRALSDPRREGSHAVLARILDTRAEAITRHAQEAS